MPPLMALVLEELKAQPPAACSKPVTTDNLVDNTMAGKAGECGVAVQVRIMVVLQYQDRVVVVVVVIRATLVLAATLDLS